MKRKCWVVIAVALILLGSFLILGSMAACEWDLTALGTEVYDQRVCEVQENFSRILLNLDTGDVRIAEATDGVARVVCYESEKEKHSVSVEDGVLSIAAYEEKKWYDYIGICFDTPEVTLYLPRGTYAALDIRCSTGDVQITGITVENINVSTSTGDICVSNSVCSEKLRIAVSTGKTEILDILCGTFESTGSTGHVTMRNLLAAGEITIERSTGNVIFDRCDASALLVETDTGDVTGTLRSPKTFHTETSTGKVSVPAVSAEGHCRIRTTTGNIAIQISD